MLCCVLTGRMRAPGWRSAVGRGQLDFPDVVGVPLRSLRHSRRQVTRSPRDLWTLCPGAFWARDLLRDGVMRSLHTRLTTATALAMVFFYACSDSHGLITGRDGSLAPTGGATVGTGGTVPGTGGSVTGAGGATGTGGSVTETGGATSTGGAKTGTGGSTATGGSGAVGGTETGLGGNAATGGASSGGITGGGEKTGGAVADAGPSKDASRDVICPPVCNIYCAYGNEVDTNNCELCKCKLAPLDGGTSKDTGLVVCPPVCEIYCPNGNVPDEHGCATCTCKPAPADAAVDAISVDGDVHVCLALPCPPIVCANGYAKDSYGCSTCACASEPGSTCADITSESLCIAAGSRCRWLAPGCSEPALSTMGCYDTTLLDCTSSCPNGRSCLQRSIDPCYDLDCIQCSQSINICL